MMKNAIKIWMILGFTFLVKTGLSQHVQHPILWVTDSERAQVLNKIEKYDWAARVVNQLHQRVDNAKNIHEKNPAAILHSIPAFGDNIPGHNRVLSLAADAGMLYYLTNEKAYAQLAADIISAYTTKLAPLTPQTTTIGGDAFYDPRTTYNMLALAYDFVYDYVTAKGATVYNINTNRSEPFNNALAQKAFKNVVGNILQEYGKPDKHGQLISNHPVLTAPGALYAIFCIDDAVERERLFRVFWETGTKHQPSFKHTILAMFGEQGIWPESLSYSFMPNISLVLNIIDRIKPEMKVAAENPTIFEGVFLFENLRLPDRRFVRFGDSKRNNDGTEPNYRYVLNLAKRKGDKALQNKAEKALIQYYSAAGGRKPLLDSGVYDNYDALQLFWGEPLPASSVEKFAYKPTVLVNHAGVALQRNGVDNNNALYGLCGIIGGAHYVHSHCTGITMELYGAGYVMAPNAGLPASVPERLIPLHERYFRLYAGNNTVIVNGTSHGLDSGSWKGGANVWQNKTVNIAAEPKHLESPVSANFSFATQFLKDEVNNSRQQRTLSIIRTSDTTGYYFDMFRSKSLGENKFHDYIYHNIGDTTTITDDKNKVLSVNETDRYQNDIGDVVQSPGWRYFENTKVTAPNANAVKVRFDIKHDNRYMHLFVPGGVAREYTKALAPPTREAENGYLKKKTQVLAIRQQGEAWDKPYVVILQPSTNKNASVQSVESIIDGQKIVGAKVVSKLKDVLITDYIICQEDANALYQNKALDIHFKGRFGIVRTEVSKGKTVLSLYIGEGETLSFKGKKLSAEKQNKAFKTITL